MSDSSFLPASVRKEKGDASPSPSDSVEKFVHISLHDHIGRLLTENRRGLKKVLKLLGKNRVQVVCGRATNDFALNNRVADRLKNRKRGNIIQLARGVYSRFMRAKNGNEFEVNFALFREKLREFFPENIRYDSQTLVHFEGSRGEKTFFLKGQEVHCAGDIEILAIGVREDYPNGLNPADIITDIHAQNGIAVFSTPCYIDGTTRTRSFKDKPWEKLMLGTADRCDAVEAYNQQLSILLPEANKGAFELTGEVKGSYLASPDLHLYGFLTGLSSMFRSFIQQTVITLPHEDMSLDIDFTDPRKVMSSLRNGIQLILNDPHRFELRAKKKRSFVDLLQLGNLTLAQIRKLYTRPFRY